MHTQTLNLLKHDHNFSIINKKGERRTKQVFVLTLLTMILEISAGMLFGSMALLADGWHMGTHVAAFMITLIAYRYSRIHANDHTFAFSAAKVGVLGGYTSSIVLGVVAILMLIESEQRFFNPHTIHFNEALAVAGFGLFINMVSALLLKNSHHHTTDEHHEHHHDHNLKAAYFHVLADALTSVLAIFALLLGKYYAWNWLDPSMGTLGALIIIRWSYSLLKETSPVLLDESIALKYKLAIKESIESDADNRISDLHIWRIGPAHFAVIISLVSHNPKEPEYYKKLLSHYKLSHITIEVNKCGDDVCGKT